MSISSSFTIGTINCWLLITRKKLLGEYGLHLISHLIDGDHISNVFIM